MFTLRTTLYNLIVNMNEQEQDDTLIVVYIGESNEDEVQQIVEKIERSFQQQLNKGLIDIIAPAANYYSDMDMSWQSKQNLDLAYLMAYAHAKGVFYVQLVDDIMTRRQFITSMKRFALIKSALANPFQPSWIVLDFCEAGFIGKLLKATELPYLITYLQLYYNDMSALDILTHLIEAKMCRQVKKDKLQCQHLKTKLWQRFNSNLFYHIENISLEDKLKLQLGGED
ncbi:alpha-1,3-mannosyl-glycoprotein 4-beta-N-acetylglucosaminyltransferase A-like [Drosophila nasuta]|uniref:alpha-1,3-mannosyl-glycoprotein 4-beta-N-acetylglucosaminyltransferase A-like n=1 Tax=Drosophila nasuta TaxID=42062 RepID=UPI00295EB0C8|nr:alpha-1,3-mannosyl-glycoprotein 4-beta-N-acetylglucosaminyltransferase A-like [Drosophila nasuta]XP_060651530.1 alpha-1,3-mannosyl-glycoprotein 4-beta-N-acetylglucosaminyltransferase A-like [Drosophila nasuta]